MQNQRERHLQCKQPLLHTLVGLSVFDEKYKFRRLNKKRAACFVLKRYSVSLSFPSKIVSLTRAQRLRLPHAFGKRAVTSSCCVISISQRNLKFHCTTMALNLFFNHNALPNSIGKNEISGLRYSNNSNRFC